MVVNANITWAVNMVGNEFTNVFGSPELGGLVLLALVAIAMMKFGMDRTAIVFVTILLVGTIYFNEIAGGTLLWGLAIIFGTIVLYIGVTRLLGEY